MIIGFCDCPRCKKLFAQGKVRRALEKEWITLTSSSSTFNTSKHFISDKMWVGHIVHVAVKSYYAQFDDWSFLDQ